MKEFWNELSTTQKIKYISISLISLLALIFILQNLNAITISFITIDVRFPLSLLIIGCMAFGYALSIMVNYKKLYGLKKENKELKNDVKSTISTPSDSIIEKL